MELERSFSVIIAMMRKNIQKRPNEVQVFASHIGHLEDRTNPLADELGRSLNGVFSGFDEDWYLSSSWRLEYSSELGDGLL